MSAATLGLAGDLASAHELHPWVTKAGGGPCLYDDVPSDAVRQAATCPVCSHTMALAFQAYAPRETHIQKASAALPSRMLLVMLCMQPTCCASQHAWKVLRVQLAPSPSAADSSAPSAAPSSARQQGQSSRGARASSAAGAAAAAAPIAADMSSAMDFGDLMAELDALTPPLAPAANEPQAALPSSSKSAPAASAPADTPVGSDAGGASARGALLQGTEGGMETAESASAHAPGAGHLVAACDALPEFLISAKVEPAAVRPCIADAHVHALLQAYQGEGEVASGGEDADGADGGGTGATEGYEKDDAYTKFTKRLMRQPHQCARYGVGMDVVWPADKTPQPSACPHCGAQRVLELQLMAPLWHFMEECVAWYTDLGFDVPSGIAALHHERWDWTTVAVYVCSDSCHVGTDVWSVVSEEVFGFNGLEAYDVDRVRARLAAVPMAIT